MPTKSTLTIATIIARKAAIESFIGLCKAGIAALETDLDAVESNLDNQENALEDFYSDEAWTELCVMWIQAQTTLVTNLFLARAAPKTALDKLAAFQLAAKTPQ